MKHITRLAVLADLDKLPPIFQAGVAYLKAQGLPQWQDGYSPTRESAAADMQAGRGYVLEVSGQVSGYASLIPEPDGSPELTEGAWTHGYGSYAAIHSVALDESVRGRGLAAAFLEDIIKAARALGYRDIRIDTHPGNQIMQRVVVQAGFTYTGVMHLPIPNGERVAYQRIL